MKFLILVKPLLGGPPMEDPITIYTAARDYINQAFDEGKLECVYQYADGRQAMAIAEVDDMEELYKYLHGYPLFFWQDYEIHPLVDVDFSFELGLQRMTAMAVN